MNFFSNKCILSPGRFDVSPLKVFKIVHTNLRRSIFSCSGFLSCCLCCIRPWLNKSEEKRGSVNIPRLMTQVTTNYWGFFLGGRIQLMRDCYYRFLYHYQASPGYRDIWEVITKAWSHHVTGSKTAVQRQTCARSSLALPLDWTSWRALWASLIIPWRNAHKPSWTMVRLYKIYKQKTTKISDMCFSKFLQTYNSNAAKYADMSSSSCW